MAHAPFPSLSSDIRRAAPVYGENSGLVALGRLARRRAAPFAVAREDREGERRDQHDDEDTHHELIAQGGLYARLAALQFDTDIAPRETTGDDARLLAD